MIKDNFSGFDIQKPLHAYLVVSPGLVAARDYSHEMAAALICENSTEKGVACRECKACKKSFAGTHPDIFMLRKKSVSVDDIRDLRSNAYLAPHESDRKVFILDNVGEYNVQSQNALLKVLEEPPKNVFFILTAASKHSVLPTVLSRVCTLTPDNHDKSFYKQTVLSAFGTNISEEISDLAAEYLEVYGITEIDTDTAASIEKAYSLAISFFSGADKDVILQFPKGKDSHKDELTLYLRVFMLIAHNVVKYKMSGGKISVSPMTNTFKKLCVRLSAKRALACYEIFEKAYVMHTEYANRNALYAYLSQHLSA